MDIDEKNYWLKTIKFINNLSSNENFKPIELKKYVHEDGYITSTVGSYITFLEQSKFIERTSKGIYIKIKNIPETLTTTKIINYLYNNPLKNRQDKLEQIKNKLENKL
jgi:hypothetical protein